MKSCLIIPFLGIFATNHVLVISRVLFASTWLELLLPSLDSLPGLDSPLPGLDSSLPGLDSSICLIMFGGSSIVCMLKKAVG